MGDCIEHNSTSVYRCIGRYFFPSLPYPFPLFPFPFLRSRVPLNQIGVCEGAVSSPAEYGALKTTGDNHFEYSELHVLYYTWSEKLD